MSTILVVDDNQDNCYLLQQWLEAGGHQVTCAEEGNQALHCARRETPELIISDIMMPVMNGFRLCHEIKKDPALRHIPLIFLTATFDDSSDRALAMSLGASRFVIKPIEETVLLKLIDEVIDEQQQGMLPVRDAPADTDHRLLEMYDNSVARKLEKTLESLKTEQEALIESEKRLKEAQELAHMGHWEVDVKSNLYEWSDEVFRILGLAPRGGRASYKTYITRVHPEDRSYVTIIHRDALVKKTQQDFEYRLLCEDGTIKYVHERLQTIYDDEGRPLYLMGILQDITERKKAEEERDTLQAQLFQSQKMEAIGVLAGGVAHDFNNLLTTIIGNAQLIISELSENQPLYGDLKEIIDAGERGAVLTKRLLTFSRREMYQPEILDLNKVVRGIEKLLRRLIKANVKLHTDLTPELWKVKADMGQIDQVIMNLGINASDAMPDGGVLAIKTANIEFGDAPLGSPDEGPSPGSYVMLSVSDTGAGMDSETMARMFEPFFTTKPRGSGTGLGLSTVYGIIHQSKGYIRPFSVPGKGTTVNVYLPRVHDGEAKEKEEGANEEERRSGGVVLVVDDEESLRRVIVKALHKEGYRVLEAANGEDALRICTACGNKIDALLTDVVMPGIGGTELAEELKSRHRNIKVLYMSGYSEKILVQKGVKVTDANFILKPFTPDSLCKKLREATK